MFDELTARADSAARRAGEAYRELSSTYDSFLEPRRERRVSRHRFTTLVDRIRRTGAPYGAHTIVYRSNGEILLARHAGVDRWVLPGGEIDPGESFIEAARRELAEEAGIEATYDGLAMVTTVELSTQGCETWGVMPVFEAQAESLQPTIRDPDDEIVDVGWFDRLPTDTRDRADLQTWRERALGQP